MLLPDLRIIFGGLALLLIAGIAFGLRWRGDFRLRGLLAVSQIALAIPLVICAGLLARSEVQRRSIYPGVSVDAGRRAVLALRTDKYGAPEQRKEFFDRVQERLKHVPGLHVADTGAALQLANNDYYALFFSMGGGQPTVQQPMAQRFINWQADVDSETLAIEVNTAVKTFDRGIHYWTVTHQPSPQDVPIMNAFGVYAALSLLLIAVSFRGETLRRAAATVIVGIVIGLSISVAVTWLLTGLLFGVSVTNLTVFALSVVLVASVAISACLVAKRRAAQNSRLTYPSRREKTIWKK
jgi:hypothetical protein